MRAGKLRQMKRAGINHVVLTVCHLASLLRAYFGDGAQWDLEFPDLILKLIASGETVNGYTFIVINGKNAAKRWRSQKSLRGVKVACLSIPG